MVGWGVTEFSHLTLVTVLGDDPEEYLIRCVLKLSFRSSAMHLKSTTATYAHDYMHALIPGCA